MYQVCLSRNALSYIKTDFALYEESNYWFGNKGPYVSHLHKMRTLSQDYLM